MATVRVTVVLETDKEPGTVRDNVVALLTKAGAKINSAFYEKAPGKLTDVSPFPFGKHKGTAMKDVDAGYLDWLRKQLDEGDGWLQNKFPHVVEWLTTRGEETDGGNAGYGDIPDDEIPF